MLKYEGRSWSRAGSYCGRAIWLFTFRGERGEKEKKGRKESKTEAEASPKR